MPKTTRRWKPTTHVATGKARMKISSLIQALKNEQTEVRQSIKKMHELYVQYAQQQKDCSFFSACTFELEYVAPMINNHIFDLEHTVLELEQIINELRKDESNERD